MPKTLSEELTLGQRLARARREAKMSQTALAEALDVSRQTISNYERGGTEEVQFEIIAKWAIVTDVSLDYFGRIFAEAVGHTRRYPFQHAVGPDTIELEFPGVIHVDFPRSMEIDLRDPDPGGHTALPFAHAA
jgi:transcriptional regulator with XRE-family HTH domain